VDPALRERGGRDRAHPRRTHAAHSRSRRQCRHHRLRQGSSRDGGV